MSLPREQNDNQHVFEPNKVQDDVSDLAHRKHIRKRLEDRLEEKRLRDEFDELDGEFCWDEFNE